MKLILCIRNQNLTEIELTPPLRQDFSEFRDYQVMKELYVREMTQALKLLYQNIIQKNPWEIYLTDEVRVKHESAKI